MLNCDFDIIEQTPNIVTIKDNNLGRRSVTNDAESVIKYLYEKNIIRNGVELNYIDSMGMIGPLWHLDGEFQGF